MWKDFFAREYAIEQLALRAGLTPKRAGSLARELASRPLSRQDAARALANVGTAGRDDPTIRRSSRRTSC